MWLLLKKILRMFLKSLKSFSGIFVIKLLLKSNIIRFGRSMKTSSGRTSILLFDKCKSLSFCKPKKFSRSTNLISWFEMWILSKLEKFSPSPEKMWTEGLKSIITPLNSETSSEVWWIFKLRVIGPLKLWEQFTHAYLSRNNFKISLKS